MNEIVCLELVGARATEKFGATLACIFAEQQFFPDIRSCNSSGNFSGNFSGTLSDKISGLYLTGELGTGKTTFTRGFVKAMPCGDKADIASPSFALCNMYDTIPPVLHCDVFRTAGALSEDLENAFDDEYPFIIVEWAECILTARLPLNRLDITFAGDGEKRHVSMRPQGNEAHIVCARFQEMRKLMLV